MDYIINRQDNNEDINNDINGKNENDGKNNGNTQHENDNVEKYPERYKWLEYWDKMSDEDRAKLFCYETKFIYGYNTDENISMDNIINNIILEYSFKHCRGFHKIVTGVYDSKNVKGDLLIFNPVNIHAIPDKYMKIKESIIQWADNNGYSNINKN